MRSIHLMKKRHNNPLHFVLILALSCLAVYGILRLSGLRQGGSLEEALKVLISLMPAAGVMMHGACYLTTAVFHLPIDTAYYLSLCQPLSYGSILMSICHLAIIAMVYEMMMMGMRGIFDEGGIWNKLEMVVCSVVVALASGIAGSYLLTMILNHFETISLYLKNISLMAAAALSVGGAAALLSMQLGISIAQIGLFFFTMKLLGSMVKICVTYIMVLCILMIISDGTFAHYLAAYTSYFGISGVLLMAEQGAMHLLKIRT